MAVNTNSDDYGAAATLDITSETCPMTFVRTRLALDRLLPGQILHVKLTGEEATRNVPQTAAQLGHHIVAQHIDAAGVMHLILRRA